MWRSPSPAACRRRHVSWTPSCAWTSINADRLLESFLVLARAQNGQARRAHQVALEPLITDALSDRADADRDQASWPSRQISPVSQVAGSATLLARMVENVIENAVRHNQPDGLIEIALALIDGRQARAGHR